MARLQRRDGAMARRESWIDGIMELITESWNSGIRGGFGAALCEERSEERQLRKGRAGWVCAAPPEIHPSHILLYVWHFLYFIVYILFSTFHFLSSISYPLLLSSILYILYSILYLSYLI